MNIGWLYDAPKRYMMGDVRSSAEGLKHISPGQRPGSEGMVTHQP